MKTLLTLRQGDLLGSRTAGVLVSAAVLKPFNGIPAASLCVVLTQDCDILHASADEPYIEFILCHSIEMAEENNLNGKNPRVLHVQNGAQILEFFIHDRFPGYKRWEKDSYSLNGQTAPVDGIDTL
jgi:hypothetical protein